MLLLLLQKHRVVCWSGANASTKEQALETAIRGEELPKNATGATVHVATLMLPCRRSVCPRGHPEKNYLILVYTRICTRLGYAPLGLGFHTKWAIIMLGLGLGLRIAYENVSPNPNGAYPSLVHIRV